MSDQYLGEIRVFAGNFAPLGWALCDGQLLAINTNTALFSLIGTMYGGDGVTTFALPDLRGRLPLHNGTGAFTATLAEAGGQESVVLGSSQIPAHSHVLNATSSFGTSSSPAGNALAQGQAVKMYQSATPNSLMATSSTSSSGGGQAHNNLQPYLCLNFIIATTGIFP